jgi:AhpC/TSA family
MTLRSIALLSACLAMTACDKPQASPDTPATTKTDGGATKAIPAATAVIGQPAPDFTLTDLDGKAHTLSQYKGKTVVLEWFNPGCPFVLYAHGEGPLKDMAAKEIAQGVVWLAINSGAPGKQGHGAEANRAGVTTFGMVNPVLLDEDGTVGHTYGAEKTPHMYVVNEAGTLVYRGGLDNAPMGVPNEGERIDHVGAALADVRAGKPVAVAETPAYGCSVKYAKA